MEPSVEGCNWRPRIRGKRLTRSRDPRAAFRTRSASICAGSPWHGPHTTDIPMKHLADLMLAINADYYSFEAANARDCEHEWKLWKEIKLPAGKPTLARHRQPLDQNPDRGPEARRRPDRPRRETKWAATTRRVDLIAGSAAACTRKSRTPSWRPSAKAHAAPPSGSGSSTGPAGSGPAPHFAGLDRLIRIDQESVHTTFSNHTIAPHARYSACLHPVWQLCQSRRRPSNI